MALIIRPIIIKWQKFWKYELVHPGSPVEHNSVSLVLSDTFGENFLFVLSARTLRMETALSTWRQMSGIFCTSRPW